MARAIIISRALRSFEKDRIEQALSGQEDIRLYANTVEGPFAKLASPLPDLGADAKKRINYEIFSRIVHFGDRHTGSTTIARLLTFETAGLWYYHKFRLYFLVRNLAYDLSVLDLVASKHNSVELYTDQRAFTIPDMLPSIIRVHMADTTKVKRHWPAKTAYLITAFIRLIIGILTQRYRLQDVQHLFVDSQWQYRSILDPSGDGDTYENAYLGYLYRKTDRRFAYIDQLIIPKFNEIPPFRIRRAFFRNHGKRKRINEEAVFFRGLISRSTVRAIAKAVRWLKTTYPVLRGLKDTDGVDRLIVHAIINLHASSVYYLTKYHVYKRFFRINRVITTTATDENSPNFKVILDAARANGITTIGYQHGSIHPLHPAYMYSEMDMGQPPVPDHTLVWGNKWRDMMVKSGHYSPDRVGVIGQLRTDAIINIQNNERITKKQLLPRCGDRFLVLFASQPQRDPSLRYRAAADVFTALRDLPDAHLVLKLHPREKDPGYYSAIAKEIGCRNYSFSGELDLYVLLYLADAVITCFSTVGTEAVYFRKPLVILDHLKQDILDYRRDGVAFQATDDRELAKILKGIREGSLLHDNDAYDRYIESTAHKIDGNVAARFLQFLQTLSNGQ